MLSLPLASEVLSKLESRGATRSPPFGEPELRALLQARGYAAHDTVLAFERDFGGLTWKDANHPDGLAIGSGACLASLVDLQPRGSDDPTFGEAFALVPIATAGGDWIAYLDADGVVWVQDTVEDRNAKPVADDGALLLAALAGGRKPRKDEKTRRAGAALAAWIKAQEKRDAAGRRALEEQGFPRIRSARELVPERPRLGSALRIGTIAKPDPRTLIERARAADHERVFGAKVTPTQVASNHLVIERGDDRVEILTALFGSKVTYMAVYTWGSLQQERIAEVYGTLSGFQRG